MNRPTLPMLRRLHGGEESNPTKKAPVWAGVSSQERTGRTFQSNEYASFIYRSDRVKMRSQRILTTQQNTFARSPFMAKFQVNSLRVICSEKFYSSMEVGHRWFLINGVSSLKMPANGSFEMVPWVLRDIHVRVGAEEIDLKDSSFLSLAVSLHCKGMILSLALDETWIPEAMHTYLCHFGLCCLF